MLEPIWSKGKIVVAENLSDADNFLDAVNNGLVSAVLMTSKDHDVCMGKFVAASQLVHASSLA